MHASLHHTDKDLHSYTDGGILYLFDAIISFLTQIQ